MAIGRKAKVLIKPKPETVAKLNESLGSLANSAEKSISTAVGVTVLAIDRAAKRKTPVDTGRLRSGFEIDWKIGDKKGRVFNQVEYAPDVEFGTGNRDGEFMLTNAYRQEIPKFDKRVKEVLRNLKK